MLFTTENLHVCFFGFYLRHRLILYADWYFVVAYLTIIHELQILPNNNYVRIQYKHTVHTT